MDTRRAPHPALYCLLFLPFGATSGFVSITLGYVGRQSGLSVSDVAGLVALGIFPQTWKFLWAPAADAFWTRKRWYVAATAVCAATIAAMGFFPLDPANLAVFRILIVAGSVASSFAAMSVEALMAHGAAPERRGRAAGWAQAGNLAGAQVGGGLGLKLWRELGAPWQATVILGVVMLLCALALLPLREPERLSASDGRRVVVVLKDLWMTVWSRASVLPLALCFVPVGVGAASGLFTAIAVDWRASPSRVEWVNGWLSGVVMAAGSLAAGGLSDRMNRKAAYALCGALLAAVAAGMALAPRSPDSYAIFCLAYAFVSGLCFGAWCAFVLEAIGAGAAATKYNVFASVANIPITYMTAVDGWAADRFGASRMMLVDAGAAIAGLAVLAVVLAALRAFPARQPALRP